MKIFDWMQIREVAPIAPAPIAPATPARPGTHGANVLTPIQIASRKKSQTAILKAQASSLGQKPENQIKKLQNTAQQIANDPNAYDGSMDDIDTKIKGIKAKAGIKI